MKSLDRDVAPDVLRGFALWGIIVVNVAYFSTSVINGVSEEALSGPADLATAFIVLALASGKFYLLFSFLFGYSASYILNNKETGISRWLGRSAGLVALGLAHAALFWMGDILFLYGLLAFVLLAFYPKSRQFIIRWVFGLYGVFSFSLVGLLVLSWAGERAGFSAQAVPAPALEEIVRHGTYLESIPARFELWYTTGIFAILAQGILTLIAFLLGMLASRYKFLDVSRMRPLTFRRLLGWGLGLGLPLQMVTAGVWVLNEVSPDYTDTLALGAFIGSFLSAPLLSAGYLGLIVWLVRSHPRITTGLGNMGRMALTTYLLQSVGLSLIFSAWGAGLYQILPYWVAVLVALGLNLILAGLAGLWLARFHQGPMERALTWFSRRFVSGSYKT